MKKTSEEKTKLEFRPLKFYRGGKPIEDKTTPEQRRKFLAFAWFSLSSLHPEYGDVEWSGVLDGVGSLQSLLLPLIALQELGDAETLRRTKREIQEVADKLRGLVDNLSSLNPTESIFEKEWKAQFDRLSANLQTYIDRMAKAEEILNRAGWKFDPMTGKAKRIRDGKGKDLLTECAGAIYTGKYQDKGNTATVRRKIKAELMPYFDAAELSEKSGAPIYMAIYKGENPPK